MMSKKPKILCWADTPTVPTGFGIVSKNLLRDLHKKYDLEILGINYHGDTKYDTEKWFIYPAASGPDILGFSKLKKILSKTKPDIIFLFQDIFHINDVWSIIEEKAPQAKTVIYFPVDGTPFNAGWEAPLLKADRIITYTNFAKQAILETFPKIKKKIHTLDHGVDTSVFKPLPNEEIRNARRELNWEGKFVLLNVNRFQPRKLIPITLRATALFTKGYNICECGNWYLKIRSICDLNGCDKSKIIKQVDGYDDVLLYLHMVPNEPGMGPGHSNSLQAASFNAGFRDEDLSGPKQTLQINAVDIYTNPFPEEVLNKLYNAACVNISTTIGEGFGFSLAESAAVGTISIAPNNSAIPEVLGDTGHLIPNVTHMHMQMDNGHFRPLVDVREVIKAIEIEYKAWLNNNKFPVKSQIAIDRVQKVFNWQDKRDFIENIFEEVLKEPAKRKIKELTEEVTSLADLTLVEGQL